MNRDDYLSQVIRIAEQPGDTPGASGYFEAPQATLDPRLFVGTALRPEVRSFILTTLYDFWRRRYHRPESWSTVWAAGSGITYQWAGDRGNGDLDILVGVAFDRFFSSNSSYGGIPEADMAQQFNDEFRAELWPTTANWNGFEVTFYVNPGAEDIRNINPYAAYNVTTDTWTVRPPVLPADPRKLYPTEFWKAVDAEKRQAQELIAKYRTYRAQAEAMAPNTPGWRNALAAQELTISQARALFDSIHLGRRLAFSSGGSGYGDYYNFRWQAHKKDGTVAALHALATIDADADSATQTDLYGEPILSADAALTQASLWSRRTA